MFAAVTDHVFIDGGHTIDFTNKCSIAPLSRYVGAHAGPLVQQSTSAARAEETFPWRHPNDLVALIEGTEIVPGAGGYDDVAGLWWRLLADEPGEIVQV